MSSCTTTGVPTKFCTCINCKKPETASRPDTSDGAIYAAGSPPMPQELADHIADAGKMAAGWPERIYLQRDEECVREGCGPHGDDTTWCRDKIHGSDVEYVRADLAPSAEPRDEHMARFRVYEEDLLPPGPLLKGQTEVWLATAQPPTKAPKQKCVVLESPGLSMNGAPKHE